MTGPSSSTRSYRRYFSRICSKSTRFGPSPPKTKNLKLIQIPLHHIKQTGHLLSTPLLTPKIRWTKQCRHLASNTDIFVVLGVTEQLTYDEPHFGMHLANTWYCSNQEVHALAIDQPACHHDSDCRQSVKSTNKSSAHKIALSREASWHTTEVWILRPWVRFELRCDNRVRNSRYHLRIKRSAKHGVLLAVDKLGSAVIQPRDKQARHLRSRTSCGSHR
jgi:hypothetical protein